MNDKWDNKSNSVERDLKDKLSVRDIDGAYPKLGKGSVIRKNLDKNHVETSLGDSITDHKG